jgi:hypothetical protein
MTKIAHLRNMYQKVGMFGMPVVPLFRNDQVDQVPMNEHMGDQVRGFGFLRDGSTDTMFRFNRAGLFAFPSDEDRRDVEAYQLAFESNLAPIVGQQVTLAQAGAKGQWDEALSARLDLMMERAALGECDLIVKGPIEHLLRGWVMQSDGLFKSDRAEESVVGKADLLRLARNPEQPLTFTCVPPGSGTRVGIDRDEDGIFDGDDPCPSTSGVSCGLVTVSKP